MASLGHNELNPLSALLPPVYDCVIVYYDTVKEKKSLLPSVLLLLVQSTYSQSLGEKYSYIFPLEQKQYLDEAKFHDFTGKFQWRSAKLW